MNTADWVQIVSTLLLAGTAFAAPYVIDRWRATYRAPKLKTKFKLTTPGCHQTQMVSSSMSYPVYYFRFLVENTGKTQAEECEVMLEKVSKENGKGEMVEYKNFMPINLKWSGIRNPITRTIQPSRGVYCDLGRVQHPDHPYESLYRSITEKDKKSNNFVFELPEVYFSQWDCLTPGKYKIEVAVYSKNAARVTRSFHISWSGAWKDGEEDMFKELTIK